MRRELVPNRGAAKELIAGGMVTVGGAPATKSARLVEAGESIQLLKPPQRYVSRAGAKLEAALQQFDVNPAGLFCLDAGSSTGGFTDCLLQHDAKAVVAVDVGTNQLHEKIRASTRVQVWEKTDIRSIDRKKLGQPVDLVVGDMSFISIKLVLAGLLELVEIGSPLLLLIKPQFEAGKEIVSKTNGVITDPNIWLEVLRETEKTASRLGAGLRNLMLSPVVGTAGNREFVGHFVRGEKTLEGFETICYEAVAAVEEANRRTDA